MNYGLIIVVTIIQAILTLTHWFLYKSLVFFYNSASSSIILSLRWTLGILSFTFLASTILTYYSASQIVNWFYIAAASWLGFVHWLVLASVLAWLIYMAGLYMGVNLTGRLYYSILLGIAVITAIYGLRNANNIRMTRLNIALPNLPIAWQGKTIAFISDLHLGAIHGESFANKITNKVNTEKPEMILLGGDVFDSAKVDLKNLIEPLHNLAAPRGIYFITGNHEEFGDKTPYLKALANIGITVLDNQMLNIGGLQLVGVDYNDTRTLDGFKKILLTITLDHNLPGILLKHAPEYVDLATQAGFNLQLYGHTHRGQMWPFNYITQAVYKGFDFGYKRVGDSQVYTSSGVGTWGPPLKVGNPAEIVIITLSSQ